VAGLSCPVLFSAFEAVPTETPANAATSRIRATCFAGTGFLFANAFPFAVGQRADDCSSNSP
jgi:Na+-transporting NADH:ubiquinone oxidoreductase subunit NqrB